MGFGFETSSIALLSTQVQASTRWAATSTHCKSCCGNIKQRVEMAEGDTEVTAAHTSHQRRTVSLSSPATSKYTQQWLRFKANLKPGNQTRSHSLYAHTTGKPIILQHPGSMDPTNQGSGRKMWPRGHLGVRCHQIRDRPPVLF